MRYWKFLKKFPVQTIVVKAVGKGDLDNLLERLAMIFRISIPVTVFARPDTGKIGYLETEEDFYLRRMRAMPRGRQNSESV